MIDDAVQVILIDHFEDRPVLIEHAVHRVANIDQDAFRKTLQGMRQVVLVAEIGPAGSEPQVGGMHEDSAPLRKKLVEPPEDRVAGHADEGQTVLFVVERADSVRRLVAHLLAEVRKEPRSFRGSAEYVSKAEIDGSVRQRIEESRP